MSVSPAADEPVTNSDVPEEAPLHLARCVECSFEVRFRASVTGSSFILVDSDQPLGIGGSGRPMCPDGHGEMALADDQAPAAEDAPADGVASGPARQRLPFPAPPFNYEGALHAIFEKRKDVGALEARFNDADDRRKKAKAALDSANSELGEMIDSLQEREEERNIEVARREQRAEEGHPEDTNLVRCTWEQAHADEACPVCTDPEAAAGRGCGDTARDSVLHVEAADRFIRLTDTDEITELVLDAGLRLDTQLVHGLSDDQRAELKDWAEQTIGLADAEGAPARPAFLGTAHIAAAGGDDSQACQTCGAILLAVLAADGVEPYPVGALVGVDCPGVEKVAGHHYPEKKKRRARQAPAE